MVGCKNESEKSKKEQSVVEKTWTAENSVQKEQQTSFHKTLTLQNISFEIKSSEEGSIQQLSIQPEGLEIDNKNIELYF